MMSSWIYGGLSEAAAAAMALNYLRDEMRVEVNRPEDLQVWFENIPLFVTSQLYIVDEKWTRRFYAFEDDGRCLTGRRVEETTSGIAVIYPLRSPNEEFRGELRYILSDGPKFTLRVRGELTTPSKAMLEHRFGRFSPGWFVGNMWQATLADGQTTHGVVPLAPISSKLSEATLVEKFRSLEIAGPIYKVSLRTVGDFRFSLVDYRLSPYNDGELCYWVGILESPIEVGKPFEYAFEVTVCRHQGVKRAAHATASKAVLNLTNDVLLAGEFSDRILPTPKKVQWGEGVLSIGNELKVALTEGGTSSSREQIFPLFENIIGPSLQRYGCKTRWVRDLHSTHAVANLCLKPREGSFENNKFDWYRVSVGAERIDVEAVTTSGLRCGLITLAQLLRGQPGHVEVRRCEVEDYASLPVRAVHFFSGRNARDLQLSMIRNILVPLKYNTIIYQCEYVEWDCAPELHHKRYGMAKDDAAAVIAEAQRLGFEVIPLINTFGHCEWLLDNDAYRHLADNPERPYAYNPSDPRVYEICERIYAEALELFKPRYFHIGHDEVTLQGFPERPENRKRGALKLLLEDTLHYYRWLKDRGVRTIIWGDQLLAPGEAPDAALAHSQHEAAWLREQLPKDIVIADWHYAPAAVQSYTSLELLSKAGFDVLACTWYNPNNIVRFAKAAALLRKNQREEDGGGKVLGLLQTTWAGYSFDRESFENALDQYTAYVLAGEAAWRGGADLLKEIPFNYQEEFGRLWAMDMLPPGQCRGWVVDLSPQANVVFDGRTGWSLFDGDAKTSSFENMPVGEGRAGRWRIAWPQATGKPAACLFEGQLSAKHGLTSAVVDINRKAHTLFFVVSSTVGGPKLAPIARTVIEYDDGTTTAIDWKPGATVLGVEDHRVAPLLPLVHKIEQPSKAPRFIHGLMWENPTPSKEIRRLITSSTLQGGSLLLFSIAGIENEKKETD